MKKELKPRQTEVSEEDMNLFSLEMAGVRRLQERSPTKVKSGETLSASTVTFPRLEEQEQQVFLKALKNLDFDVVFRDAVPTIGKQSHPLGGNRLRQLKSGAIRITCEIDLHGLTRNEALENLARFITGACNQNQKAVLVITGKGNNSPGEPVLVSAVACWLRENGKGMVAEFATAPRQMGGNGAFVVFLKCKEKLGKNAKIQTDST